MFFEVVAEQTKLAGIKTQKLLYRVQRAKKKALEEKLEQLRDNFHENSGAIFQAEKDLGKICDNEVRDKLQDLKIFEILKSEKPSPHFIDIAKKPANIEKLSDICDTEGKVLLSGKDLNNYITNFYSSLYRYDDFVQGEIEDFLGQDICQHPLVRGSILSQAERENLDRDLSEMELDKALESANT